MIYTSDEVLCLLFWVMGVTKGSKIQTSYTDTYPIESLFREEKQHKGKKVVGHFVLLFFCFNMEVSHFTHNLNTGT